MASLNGVTTRLSGCFTGLTAAQDKIAAAITQAEEILDTANELGAEETADRISKVIDALRALDQQLTMAKSNTSAVASQVLAIAQGNAAGQKATGPVSPGGPAQTPVAPPELTAPSRTVDPSAVPSGEPEENLRAARRVQDALGEQDRSAKILAEKGYRVRRLPQDKTTKRSNPDFEVEGRIFDCYSPEKGTPLGNIRSSLRQKAKKGQADRFVVNLDRSDYSPNDLRDYFTRNPSNSIREILVIKNGEVSRVWP